MIASDQPTIFKSQIIVGLSSTDDGNMKKDNLPPELQIGVEKNREQFLHKLSLSSESTVLVKVSYEKDDFTLYETVGTGDKGKGIVVDGAPVADALTTTEKNIALFLPIADCVGAIIYDPKKHVLMVSHLGRQSTEQHGASKSVQYLVDQFGCNPSDILVWCSPSPSAENYPLHVFDNRSLQDVNKEHFIQAGVLTDNIEVSPIDNSVNTNYFSHSQFKKGHREIDGRFAIVAMLSSTH